MLVHVSSKKNHLKAHRINNNIVLSYWQRGKKIKVMVSKNVI